MDLLQKLCSVQRRAAGVAMAAKVQSGIKEIIKMIGKGRISGSAFCANHDGISPRTSAASHVAIFKWLPILQQQHQQKHQLRLLRLSPL